MTSLSCLLLLLLSHVNTQEVTTPASLLGPRNFNHHAFNPEQYLQNFKIPETTKQGPVLFPNDAPPPPRPPLIVTSRPLIESIARSDLNPDPTNNSIAEQSQINRVTFRPEYLARVKEYKPFEYKVPVSFGYDVGSTKVPYADLLKKYQVNDQGTNRFNDYEQQTILPPIYKALLDHANQKMLKIQNNNNNNVNYQVQEPSYNHNYQSNDANNDGSNSDGSNYAFSYAVKDKKTGDDFSHNQHSSGSATTGEYRVRLPDGRMQIVSYVADENGYKADVRYDDEQKISENSIDNQYNDNHYKYTDNNNDNLDKYNSTRFNDNYSNNQFNDINIRNDYKITHNQNDDIQYRNDYVAPIQQNYYSDANIIKDYANNDYAQQRDFNNGKDDYYNNYDASKEYYNDYSSEYNTNYGPHKSKFSPFTASTVKPSYDELKDLFVTKSLYNTQQNYDSPSSTPSNLDLTTERVVLIGAKPNLYTSISNSIPVTTPLPLFSNYVSSTPRNYLVSTIASIQNKISLHNKPILSNKYIDKINKYLTFK